MNQKNVEALAAAISRSPVFRGFVVNALGLNGEDHPDIRDAAEDVAREIIAADGVLVPSALTDDEAVAVNCAADDPHDPSFNPAFVKSVAAATRAELEHIAKGEP